MPPKKGGNSSDTKGNSLHLFPRIPDEVTLNQIVPKLSWRDLWVLSSVSRAWCHAIKSRQVYSARVHHQASETLVILNLDCPFHIRTPVLYSIRDKSFHKLPPIPGLTEGFPRYSQSVSLDGKLYVLGGHRGCGDQVYVFDPVGRRQWKRCSDMINQRADFACGVMDGKIYVFGGRVNFSYNVSASEVYDPKKDTWFKIKPMTMDRYSHHATIVDKEFLVYSGMFRFYPDVLEYESDDDEPDSDTAHANFLEVYDPAKDEWRLIRRSWMGTDPLLFVAQGKLYRTNRPNRPREQVHIYVHDADDRRWNHLHECTFVSVWPADSILVKLFAVLAVNDELLAIVSWRSRDDAEINGFSLVKSEGFLSDAKEMRWENVLEATPYLEDFEPGEPDVPDFSMNLVEV